MNGPVLPFSPQVATSALTFAIQVFAEWQAGKVVVLDKTGIKVDGKQWDQSLAPQPCANQQPLSIEEIKRENDRFLVGMAAVSRELEVVNANLRTTIAAARAVAEEVKEVMVPYADMYKDGRFVTAKAQALRAGIPELIVDTIVTDMQLSKFPTTDRLVKYLHASGGMKKLAASGYGTSRSSIGRYHGDFRKILVRHGLVNEYRRRSDAIPARPSKSSSERVDDAKDDLPSENETGLTRPDTRGQELGGGDDDFDEQPE